MTNKEASEILDDYDINFEGHTAEEIAEAFDVAFRALEQEPCEDAVSRQSVLDLIEHYNSDGLGSVFYGYEQGVKFADAVNKLPSVKPQEPKTGRWIERLRDVWYVCSECHDYIDHQTNYCSNCGAKMESEE